MLKEFGEKQALYNFDKLKGYEGQYCNKYYENEI